MCAHSSGSVTLRGRANEGRGSRVEPWTKEEFAGVMHQLAVSEAPRLFAIVEEYGETEDARVAGYGLAYADRAEAWKAASGSVRRVRRAPGSSSSSARGRPGRSARTWCGSADVVRGRRADGGQPSGG